MIRIMTLLMLLAQFAVAGQSLNLNGRIVGNTNVPIAPNGTSWRIEMYFHDWDDFGGKLAQANAYGADIGLTTAGSRMILRPEVSNLTGATGDCDIDVQTLSAKRVYLRLQKDSGAKKIYCEAWDMNGNRIGNKAVTYKGETALIYNTVWVGNEGLLAKDRYIGFFRICSTLLPLNSRPPITRDDSNRILEWKFDGNLTDSAGAFPAQNLAGGTLSYITTPIQTIPSVTIKNNDTRFWSDLVSIRAGHPAKLNGLSSYSQADNGSVVSYRWRQMEGPSQLIWDDETSPTPTIRGAVFGSYKLRLTVIDALGVRGSKTVDLGAVATDNNGVVIHANPDADKIFGPMIAFGKNPWAYADDAAMRGVQIRAKDYVTKFSSPPEWTKPLDGTISYNATGDYTSVATNLSAPVTASSTSIPVVSVAKLDLTEFPTIIAIATHGNGGEFVLICSASGLNLIPCYDGRGYGNTGRNGSGAPLSWPAGREIYQNKVYGAGTKFLRDFCPGGVGLDGEILASAGTVTVEPNSTNLVGIGTNWPLSLELNSIRIEGTHGGVPFVFFAAIEVGNTPTTIKMTRPWPADADAATGLSYQIIRNDSRGFSPAWTRTDGTEGYGTMNVTACLSDTRLYWEGGYEAIRGVQKDKTYSYIDHRWVTNNGGGGINFYDEVLANYAQYFRSGLKPALDAARAVGDYWLSQPDINDGWVFPAPRNMSAAGVVAGAVLDGRVQSWYALRKLAERGVVTAERNSCFDDPRESAYEMMWLAFAAMFDPVDTGNPDTPNQRSYWKAKLAKSYARDLSCKGPDNSFSSPFYFYGNEYPTMGVKNGSTEVTGSGFRPNLCPRVAGGTGNVVQGSGILTITSGTLVNGLKIVLAGTRGGQPYTPSLQFSGLGSSTTLSALWLGDTGSVTWQVENDLDSMAMASTPKVSFDSSVYSMTCTYNSPTSLTLIRPWPGPTGNAYMTRGGLPGIGMQPFMAGIKALQMKYASLGADGTLAANYSDLANKISSWVLTDGFDPDTGGLFYGRGFANCEPVLKASQPSFEYRNVFCSNGTASWAKATARALLAEAQSAVRIAYEANPSQHFLELGDQFYANLWGRDQFTQQGFALAESGISNDFAADMSLSYGKWYGFQFGIGMAHQWPAVRIGGVRPVQVEQASINFDKAGINGAAKARLTVTEPSGRTIVYTCADSPCQVDLDRRQGDHWLKIEYLSASDEILLSNKPQLLFSDASTSE
ncbi:PKD domain-containing protein [Bryobacter aggregatus]|uniref:PKD domain-containing protein n=1 Tax=Bryobacter aggregatus TaxID=360054 RepID=UPI0004E1BB8E|nr:hypothetical protein [Bryobacter aggregatus]